MITHERTSTITITSTVLSLLLAAPTLAQDKKADEKPAVPDAPAAVAGVEVLSSAGEARGDPARAFEEMLAAVARDPDSPGALLAANALSQAYDQVPGSRKRALAALEKASKDAKSGWAAERYQDLIVGLRWSAGDREGAFGLSHDRGYVRRWAAVGPFGRGHRSVLHDAFPPEVDARSKSFDPKARYTTTKGEASWAIVPGAARLLPWVMYGQALRSTSGAVYCTAHVKAEKDEDAVLQYWGPSAKLFCDRALVGVYDRAEERTDREARFPTKLHAGWNRIVVKIGDWGSGFALRVATPEGRPIALEEEKELAGHDVPANAEAPVAARPSDVLERLAKPKDALEHALRAHALLTLAGLGEEADAEVELAKNDPAVKDKAWFHVLRARTAEAADNLQAAARRVKSRAAWEAAVSADPHHALARKRLADILLKDDKTKEGIVELEKILADCPRDLAIRFELFETLSQKGWERDALRQLDEIEKLAPDASATIAARARVLRSKGDIVKALALEEKLRDEDKGATWVLAQKGELAQANGDFETAKKLLDEEASLDPEPDARFAVRYADLARAKGDFDGQVAALERAIAARPLDMDFRERLARTLAERGSEADLARAVKVLDEVLEEDPSRHGARRLRNALQGKTDEFWKEWEVDAREVVKNAPGPEAHPRAASIVLHDQTVTRIYPDGSAVEVVHQLIKVLNEEGIDHEEIKARSTNGELMEVRTFAPSGEVFEPIRASGGSWEMPALAPGAVIEHEYRLEHGARDLQFMNGPWYFKDPGLVQPFVHSRWIVIAPKDFPVEAIERNLESNGAKKSVQNRGDLVVHIWETHDQDRVEEEPNMPSRDEFLPWVKLYERRSLDELSGIYRDQAIGRTQVTPSVQAKTDEVLAEAKKKKGSALSDVEKAEAIYAFVKEHVKQPSGGASAAQILAAKGGSKQTLFESMLRAAHVGFRHALAGGSPDYDSETDWDHPVPGQFHTSLLHLEPRDGPAQWLVVDGPRYAPFGLMPASMWGAPVMILDKDGGSLDVLPRGNPADTAQMTVAKLALDAKGTAAIDILQMSPGFDSYRLKEVVKDLPRQRIANYVEGQINSQFTGATVEEWSTPGLTDPSVPFEIKVKATAPKVVRKRGDGTRVLATGLTQIKLKQALGGRSHRRFDLVLRGWTAVRDTIRVDLGPWVAPRLPPETTLQAEFGQYSLSFVREGAGLKIERSLTLSPSRVKPDAYGRFLDFLRQVDAAEDRPIVVEPREEK